MSTEASGKFNIENFREARRQRIAAEQSIIAEAAKMGIDLTAAQACVFINSALAAYPERHRASAQAAGSGDRPNMPAMAQFLIDRIKGNLDWSRDFDEFANDWNGHVEPALSRLEAALASQPATESDWTCADALMNWLNALDTSDMEAKDVRSAVYHWALEYRPAPALPEQQSAARPGGEELIKRMVDRFLSWRLPEDFNPDGGISFKKAFNEHTAHPMKHEPSGTNLFDATQAEAMVRHMVADDAALRQSPAASEGSSDWKALAYDEGLARVKGLGFPNLTHALNALAELSSPAGVERAPTTSGADVRERVARAIGKVLGVDFDEVCPMEGDDPADDGCDSPTCPGALTEDHDAPNDRERLLRMADAALSASQPAPIPSEDAGEKEVL